MENVENYITRNFVGIYSSPVIGETLLSLYKCWIEEPRNRIQKIILKPILWKCTALIFLGIKSLRIMEK